MKRFRFGLQTLLNVLKQRMRQAEVQVALARREADACRERLRCLHEAVADLARRMGQVTGPGVPVANWTALFAQSSRLEEGLRAAEGELTRAQETLRQAVQARTRLSGEVEALVTLRHQHWERYCLENRRAEQEHLDDLSLRQWSRGPGPIAPLGSDNEESE